MKTIWKMLVLISGSIILDQITKGAVQNSFRLGETMPIIDGLFSFTYVQNRGAAFGMGASSSGIIRALVIFILPVAACFWLASLVWVERHRNKFLSLAYSLILSGAIGNLIDRFTMNYVVDFLDFYWKTHHFPAFNVADTAISIGAILLFIEFLFLEKRRQSASSI